jgi:hypothetical protein
MKFGILFEYFKIPEWYNMYLDYEKLKHEIESIKKEIKKENNIYVKLNNNYEFIQDPQSGKWII